MEKPIRTFTATPFTDGEIVMVDQELYVMNKGDHCSACAFVDSDKCHFVPCSGFIFKKKQEQRLMTNRQLAKWGAKNNGQIRSKDSFTRTYWFYDSDDDDKQVDKDVAIRYWDSISWIKPTYDVYERDCINRDSCIKGDS